MPRNESQAIAVRSQSACRLLCRVLARLLFVFVHLSLVGRGGKIVEATRTTPNQVCTTFLYSRPPAVTKMPLIGA